MNPILQQAQQNRPQNIIQQFNQFKQQYAGQNPDTIIQQMLNSGQVTQEQYQQAVQQARQLSGFFK